MQAADDAGVEPVEVFRAGEDVEPELLAKLSTMGHPPRVMALFRQASLPRGVEPVSLSLWRVGDPGNLGTILRTANASGASGVVLVGPTADPFDPAAVKASMGAVFGTPVARLPDLDALFTGCRDLGVAVASTSGAARTALWDVDYPERLVLLLGSEGQGLPPDAVGCAPRGVEGEGEADGPGEGDHRGSAERFADHCGRSVTVCRSPSPKKNCRSS